MRVLYAILCATLWMTFLAVVVVELGVGTSDEIFWFTTSIVTAGALAGGD